MEATPEGYRAATSEEKYVLTEAGSDILILQERSKRLRSEKSLNEANIQLSEANIQIIERDIEAASTDLARSLQRVEGLRRKMGILPDDKKGVIAEGGVTYVRIPASTAGSFETASAPAPLAAAAEPKA